MSACLLTYLEGEVFSKMSSTLKGKNFAPMGTNSSLYEMSSIYMAGNNEMTELPPLKAYPLSVRSRHFSICT